MWWVKVGVVEARSGANGLVCHGTGQERSSWSSNFPLDEDLFLRCWSSFGLQTQALALIYIPAVGFTPWTPSPGPCISSPSYLPTSSPHGHLIQHSSSKVCVLRPNRTSDATGKRAPYISDELVACQRCMPAKHCFVCSTSKPTHRCTGPV